MYRVVSLHVVKSSSRLLRHCNPLEIRVAAFSKSPVSPAWYNRHTERKPCPPEKPPPLPPLNPPYYLIGTGILLVLTAGFMVYAKNNDEVRDWLSINAPWFDDMIAVVYEENKPLAEGVMDYVTYFKDVVDKYIAGPPEECFPDAIKPPVNVSDQVAITDATCDDDEDEEEEEEEEEEEDEEKPCVVPPEPFATKDVCKFEECLKDAYEDAVHNYMSLRDYCDYYNKLVQYTLSRFHLVRLKALKDHKKEKEEFVEQYECSAKTALKRFNDLSDYMLCGVCVPKERLDVTKQMAKDFKDIIKRTQVEYTMAHQRSEKLDIQWKSVACLMDQYLFESSCMFSELDYSDEYPQVNAELDLMLIHTKKYVDDLRQQQNDSTDYISGKISRAYLSIPVPKGKKKELDAKLANAVKKAKTDLEKEYADKVSVMCKDWDDELKKKLKERQIKFEETLAERIESKREELCEKADNMVEEKVAKEREKLQKQLDAMQCQLSAVEAKLNARLEAEREMKRAQVLHSTSQSLLQKTKRGDPRVCVEKELEILRKESADDELVAAVINAIPGEVRDKGLVPESVIRKGFYSMEDVAMKVAMVEAEGGPLPLYAFSWIQSKFLFMKPSSIPQVELDNPPKDPIQDMDTFDLLQRARYFMNKGSLANAVRYVNAMEGASRGAAEAWYQSANALLQTRLAAEAIIAHAAAITLQYI